MAFSQRSAFARRNIAHTSRSSTRDVFSMIIIGASLFAASAVASPAEAQPSATPQTYTDNAYESLGNVGYDASAASQYAINRTSSSSALPIGRQVSEPGVPSDRFVTPIAGPPYQANGTWYVPTPEPDYDEVGTASWYGADFEGKPTSNGEVFDRSSITAAHPTLPIPCLVQVTNLENGRQLVVRINDRGPFVAERVIDLSEKAAELLAFHRIGVTSVRVRYLGPAPTLLDTKNPGKASASQSSTANSRAALTQGTSTPGRGDPAAKWQLQLGAFFDLANAHRSKDELAPLLSDLGPLRVVIGQVDQSEVYKLVVGQFSRRDMAESARARIAAELHRHALIVPIGG